LKLPAPDELTPTIRKWKPYPGYKDSSVEWLGTIPEHWNVSTLKLLAPTVNRGRSPDYVEDGGIPVINQACIYWEGLHLENVKYDSGKNGNNGKGRLFPGDVLVNSTGTGTLGRASVFRREQTYFADGHVTVVRLNQTAELPEYLFYLLQTQIYRGFIYSALVSGSTNQIELSRESFRATPTIVPPFSEQTAIAAFLDRETAKIDALVAKKERLIELLQEKRAALITRAVIKGLDPNVPMKDSGVEWLGEIPAHWETKMIKHTWSLCEYGISDALSGDGPIRVLTMGNIQDGRVIIPEVGCLEYVSESMLLKRNDLLFNRTNSLIHVGKVGLFEGDGEQKVTFASYLVRIRAKATMSPRFLVYALNIPPLLEFARSLALPSINQANLNPTRYGQIKVGVPLLREQHVIGEYLDRESTQIDGLIAKVGEGIEKLKEYRTALISAAVTGKIDVRQETSLKWTADSKAPHS
jgi:type I restriction enzyme S subunit